MKKNSSFLLFALLLAPRAGLAVDGPEIFLTRYLGTGMEESFIVACPGGKSKCQMRGTGEGAPPRAYSITRSKVDSLASEFQGRAGDAVSEKKAGALTDPGHETAAMGWRVRIGGKVSQGILEREEPKEPAAKTKYEKARKALLRLETDLRAIEEAQTAKTSKKKK